MSITREQIDQWRQAPSEHQRLEFKEAKYSFDERKLFEYCVALANEGGGHLLLGVHDKPPRPVVGTRAFLNPLALEAKIFEVLGFRVVIEEVAHPDGRVLVFLIPSRPRGSVYHHNGKYLMRAGSSLVAMSEDHLRRIFGEGFPDWLEEPSKTGLDAQAVGNLLDTQALFELLKLPYPSNRAGVMDRLTQERLVDESGGRTPFADSAQFCWQEVCTISPTSLARHRGLLFIRDNPRWRPGLTSLHKKATQPDSKTSHN